MKACTTGSPPPRSACASTTSKTWAAPCRHHSFFEMMGNFSFGDYFKKRGLRSGPGSSSPIPEWMGLDPDRLYVTIYTRRRRGLRRVDRATSACPLSASRAGTRTRTSGPPAPSPKGPMVPAAPAQRSSTTAAPTTAPPTRDGPNTGSGDRFIEVWNLVFTQFDRQRRRRAGAAAAAEHRHRAGLRTPRRGDDRRRGRLRDRACSNPPSAAVAERWPAEALPAARESVSHRVIADHVRAVAFAITDGVLPANDGAGYVIKMLIRRASRHAWLLGIREPILHTLVDTGRPKPWATAYPELGQRQANGSQGIIKHRGGAVPAHPRGRHRSGSNGCSTNSKVRSFPGDVAFDLWQTHGFPLDHHPGDGGRSGRHGRRRGLRSGARSAHARSPAPARAESDAVRHQPATTCWARLRRSPRRDPLQ